jgi:Family of unknown function (DUF6459)
LTGLGPRRCRHGDRQAPRLLERPGRRHAAALLCAQLTDQELTLRQQARTGARRTLPTPAVTARALGLAICEVEAGLRSASQLERVCHPSLWEAVAHRIQRAGGPPVSGASALRIRVQELQPGLVDAAAVIRRGQRAVFIALRLEAVPGRWELIELLY